MREERSKRRRRRKGSARRGWCTRRLSRAGGRGVGLEWMEVLYELREGAGASGGESHSSERRRLRDIELADLVNCQFRMTCRNLSFLLIPLLDNLSAAPPSNPGLTLTVFLVQQPTRPSPHYCTASEMTADQSSRPTHWTFASPDLNVLLTGSLLDSNDDAPLQDGARFQLAATGGIYIVSTRVLNTVQLTDSPFQFSPRAATPFPHEHHLFPDFPVARLLEHGTTHLLTRDPNLTTTNRTR